MGTGRSAKGRPRSARTAHLVRRGRAHARAHRWREAADAYAAAAARDNDPRLHARAGRMLERQRFWGEAADAYRRAIALDPGRARWHVRLAESLVREQRWPEAAEEFNAAVELKPRRARSRFRLARALEQMGDLEGALAANRAALACDGRTSALDHELLAADVRRFHARRRIGHFVSAHLDEIHERAAAGPAVREAYPRIWVYWAQGIESAPAVVRRCHEELRRLHAPEEILVLDDSLVPDYVDIPEVVRRRTGRNKTKFADVLRVELLLRYGGVWLDATCLVRRRVFDAIADDMGSGFLAYRYRPGLISTWLMASEPGHPIVRLLREAQIAYWEHYRRPIDYYVLHHLFEALDRLDEDFRARWAATPERSSEIPTLLQYAMDEPFDPQRYRELLEASWIHKLTYKFPAPSNSHLAAFVRGEAPR